MTSLGWSSQKYAALNDHQIRISSGSETKKIEVLDSEPNQSLAKSPNAHWTAVCGEITRPWMTTREDARKDGLVLGRSNRLVKYPDYLIPYFFNR